MARIMLQVEIDDLDNANLEGFDDKFETWLRKAYHSLDAPDGHIDCVTEIDREEDEDEEEET